MTLKPVMLAVLIVLSVNLFAQQKYHEWHAGLSPQDFIVPQSTAADSGTTAVILSDSGVINFTGNLSGRFVVEKQAGQIVFKKNK